MEPFIIPQWTSSGPLLPAGRWQHSIHVSDGPPPQSVETLGRIAPCLRGVGWLRPSPPPNTPNIILRRFCRWYFFLCHPQVSFGLGHTVEVVIQAAIAPMLDVVRSKPYHYPFLFLLFTPMDPFNRTIRIHTHPLPIVWFPPVPVHALRPPNHPLFLSCIRSLVLATSNY